ncbi:hypothetical protein [Streptomyces sp. NPDC091268]|uniref:hypothetical protein n=1 Tax=Streptomyces sp. NPDC091268 TaxID=3365979 RepID=UPI0038159198
MTDDGGFGGLLTRMMAHRALTAGELAVRVGAPADEVRAVLAGVRPGEGLLRRLAPALGFHAVDLFILAGSAVPEDLAPLDAAAARWVAGLVTEAVRLPEARRRGLLLLVRSLPQEERRAAFAPKPPVPRAGGPGSRIVRMLQYRNLNWSGMAHALAYTTPTYLSAATCGVIGRGQAELTPRLVTDCAIGRFPARSTPRPGSRGPGRIGAAVGSAAAEALRRG